jgi:hypothetical protein
LKIHKPKRKNIQPNVGMKIVAWTSSQKRFSTSGNQKDKQMKTIKTIKTCCVLIGAASLFATPNLFASVFYEGIYTGTISASAAGGNANSGGAFKATTAPTGGTDDLGTFVTFCLNSTVNGSFNTTYNYTSSDTVIPGGVSVATGTAWLYSEFRLNKLATDVAGFTYDNGNSYNALQAAIWVLQGDAAHGEAADLVGLALELYQAAGLALPTDNNYGVFALNLTTANGSPIQPMLGMVAPVPEPSTIVAGALLLLPFGVSTLRIMRKNKVQ